MLATIVILILLLIALQFGKTQTILATKIVKYLEDQYKVSLQLENIKVNPFGDFTINQILIKDHHLDTLAYVDYIKGSVFDFHKIKNRKLSFKNIYIENSWVDDKIYDGELHSSLSVFSKKFKKNKENSNTIGLYFKNVHCQNVRYKRQNDNNAIVNFKNISGVVPSLVILGSDIKAKVDSLSFNDIYGINYKKLKTDFAYSHFEMSFKKTRIKTLNSDVVLDAKFIYNDTTFVDFVNLVQLEAVIDSSHLSLKDIHKIYPHFDESENFTLQAELNGTLNDLAFNNTKLFSEDNLLALQGDFLVKNSIYNREQFWLSGTKSKLKLTSEKLKTIVPNQYHKNLPKELYGLKKINFNGDVYVSRKQLVLNGGITSNLGNIITNGSLKGLDNKTKQVDFKFRQGSVFKNKYLKDFKKIFFKGNIAGEISTNNLVLKSDVYFSKIKYKNNTLSNSHLKLNYINKNIEANFSSKDSLLSFDSSLDYKNIKAKEKEFDVNFKITQASLSKLFPQSISYQKNILATGQIKIRQLKDTITARGFVKNLHIETATDSFDLSDLALKYSSMGLDKNIQLNSNKLVRLKVHGAFDFTDFEKLVENALYKFIPGSKVRTDVKDQTISFGMEIYPEFLKSITNKISLDKTLTISGVLDTKGDKGVIYANAPSFYSKNLKVDSLRVVLDNSNQFINSNISAHTLKYKKQEYENLSLLGKKINDTLFVRSNFKSDKIDNRAVFYLTTHDDFVNVGIENVHFKYLNSIWNNITNKQNKVKYNYKTGEWNFSEISFGNKKQEFEFNGNIQKEESKNLKLSLKKINLADVLPDIDSLKVAGLVSGDVFFKEKNTLLKPAGDLIVEGLKINGVNYGLMKTSIVPSNKELGYKLKLQIASNEIENIDASGEITVSSSSFLESDVDLNVKLNNLKLNSLSPLGRNVLSAVRGKAKGEFKITGKLNDFNSLGDVYLTDGGLKFPYLNTNYNFVGNTRIELKGKTFTFHKVDLEDEIFKTKGVLKGVINYDKYNNWNLDLRVDTDNLLVMNTELKDNSKYYGTGFMDGFATIKGATSDLFINVTGRTLENTKFVLPISDVKEVEDNKFIYFKEPNKETEENRNTQNQVNGGVAIVLNLDITKDALGEIVIDQTSGSSLLGRVEGKLIIDIDKLFNIKMFGDMVVDQGLYNFKYGGIVNKPFVVKKGGTVSWNGNPYKADLNIEAVHSVKANPKILLESLPVNRKIDVDLVTKVTGELFESCQDFLIEIPNASSNVASELDFKLNVNEDIKTRQFFSLLVSKTFFDENNLNSTGAVLSNTTSELISNAVTDIFNKGDSKFQLNLGYTAGETSDIEDFSIDDQIDIGVETEISERILINGKLGVPVGTTTQSAVVGEVKVEVLLNKNGTLRSSFFNRQNEIQYSEEEQGYTQGVGLNYQIDFNNLTEMLQKLRLKSQNKKEKSIDENENRE